jgi:hypothetical protein
MGKHYTPEELRAHALAVLDDDAAAKVEADLPVRAPNEVTLQLKHMARDGLGIKCIKLALAGKTRREIAVELSISERAVNTYIRRVMTKTAQNAGADELRGLELRRLDRIVAKLWPLIDPEDENQPPNLAAIDRFLKVQQARRALMGLDRPKKVDVDVTHKATVHAQVKAERLNALMDIADQMVAQGIGSGRAPESIEGEVVDDDE